MSIKKPNINTKIWKRKRNNNLSISEKTLIQKNLYEAREQMLMPKNPAALNLKAGLHYGISINKSRHTQKQYVI